ncbi:putative mitochondrial protein AtMg00820 [Apium graveolens]|uniref:putative mitochondrial protein AtMg00820 n=1 Tax=Apium graveolens TaxID=4045 RepID=UPI003D79237D
MAKIIPVKEPTSFAKAVLDPKWVDAIYTELAALEANNTWSLVPLPSGKSTVGCKWVFKIKYLPNGDVDRYKARSVEKGYTQQQGVDFHDTFAPVAKGVTVKIVFALASAK